MSATAIRNCAGLLKQKSGFGLSVLDYIVTSKNIHLLNKDTGSNVISNSIQLIAGRSAQQYNQRKARHGAFWEDRYHATAVEVDEHLHRCLVYIDLNRVRAGVVTHPSNWAHSGYREIHNPPKRYGIIDVRQLSALCGFSEVAAFQQAHRDWVEDTLRIPRPGVPKNSFRGFTSMIPTDESSPHITARHTGPRLTKRISSSAAEESKLMLTLTTDGQRYAANFDIALRIAYKKLEPFCVLRNGKRRPRSYQIAWKRQKL